MFRKDLCYVQLIDQVISVLGQGRTVSHLAFLLTCQFLDRLRLARLKVSTFLTFSFQFFNAILLFSTILSLFLFLLNCYFLDRFRFALLKVSTFLTFSLQFFNATLLVSTTIALLLIIITLL